MLDRYVHNNWHWPDSALISMIDPVAWLIDALLTRPLAFAAGVLLLFWLSSVLVTKVWRKAETPILKGESVMIEKAQLVDIWCVAYTQTSVAELDTAKLHIGIAGVLCATAVGMFSAWPGATASYHGMLFAFGGLLSSALPLSYISIEHRRRVAALTYALSNARAYGQAAAVLPSSKGRSALEWCHRVATACSFTAILLLALQATLASIGECVTAKQDVFLNGHLICHGKKVANNNDGSS